jgi:glycosyltransferase involved in cell wall biosynthesis
MNTIKDPVSSDQYPGRLAILQRVLPSYRVPFFELLAGKCPGGFHLAAGIPRKDEAIDSAGSLAEGHFQLVENIHLFRGKFYLCWQKGLHQWLQSVNPDALIVEANPRNLSTRSAVAWMNSRTRPVIGWGLGSVSSGGFLNGLRNSVRFNFLNQFDALITYSRQGYDQYRSLGFPENRIFIAHNAAATRPTHSSIQRPERSENPPNLLYVGRLQARKRINLLINACANLPDGMKPGLVIVGDGPERGSLQNLAESIYPSTHFAGALYGQDLDPFYKAADIFVLPGTGGLAIQQAMGWSLPIIAAQGDGTQGDLVRKENGWQVPPGDQAALEDTLREAMSDLTRLRTMGLESYRIVSEEINLESMVTSFVTVLNSISR